MVIRTDILIALSVISHSFHSYDPAEHLHFHNIDLRAVILEHWMDLRDTLRLLMPAH